MFYIIIMWQQKLSRLAGAVTEHERSSDAEEREKAKKKTGVLNLTVFCGY